MSDSITETGPLPEGFFWGAVRAGIKASGNPDLAVAVAPRGASAAAMFTRNRVVAAPVLVGKSHLAASRGRVRAVVVNAGNANCATGEAGLRACLETCKATAAMAGCIFDEVFPSSTGIIGVPLPVDKILAALPSIGPALGNSAEHAEAFARAIMTTDTKMKIAVATIDADGVPVRLFGTAKGAGMIYPQLEMSGPAHATMLVYLFTDLTADPAALEAMLAAAVAPSLNSISIDGDTSTNDTVLLLASGASGVALTERTRPAFEEALRLVCESLAHQIVDDGEGVGHVVTLEITGAQTDSDARAVATSIAHSLLNKTAWSSADPNWGRLLAAAGRSDVPFELQRVSIAIAGQVVFENGMRSALFDREAAHQAMSAREYTIHIALGEGHGTCRFLTCDLTEEYVRINADYST